MKNFISFIILGFIIISCSTTKNTSSKSEATNSIEKKDTIRIANYELEYEVIIIDPGFSNWLSTKARPRQFHSQNYMESRNRTWVNGWNSFVNTGKNPNLFQMSINYQNNIDYGYEVNYLLFNYLTYFQITNNIQLGGFFFFF